MIAGSRFEVESNEEVEDYYEFEATSLPGYFDIEAAGGCGLVSSNLYAPGSLLTSADLFGCDAAFFEANEPPSGKSTRSDLQVDGANAYTPTTARYLEEDLDATIPGAPRISVTQAFDPATGARLDPRGRSDREVLAGSGLSPDDARAARNSSRQECSSNAPGRRAAPTKWRR